MKLSIIVPVYNSGRTVSKCLKSILTQLLKVSDFEVIVINDGSTDNSEEIILTYASRHQNIKYIKQNNKGVSTARNAGLDIAKGNYITFVDSDDEIEKNTLNKIIEKLESECLDILYPLIDTYSEKGEHLSEIAILGETKGIRRGIFQERRTYTPTFYRKDLLKHIRFHPRISFGEDTVFNAKAQALAERVAFIDIPYYKYTVRENSLSKQGRTRKVFEGFLLAILEIRTFQNLQFNGIVQSEYYFEKVYVIFVTRILELSVIPQWSTNNYKEMIDILEEMKLKYILERLSDKYPYVGKSFWKFKKYQQYVGAKSKVKTSLYRIYKRFWSQF